MSIAAIHEFTMRAAGAFVVVGAMVAYWRDRLPAGSAEKRLVLAGFALGAIDFVLATVGPWL